uniref:hypothetical protein n=1 Tax=Corynebacterium casei TaxID=160386 RepID=UPI000BF083D3|nr:hypothetical protein [Corynebacterium casei]
MENSSEMVMVLCKELESLTGQNVKPETEIGSLTLNSLEVLQVVLSTERDEIIQAMPKFFEEGATPESICDPNVDDK